MSHAESNLPSDAATGSQQGVGARLLRKEDDRFMRGRGQYVADIRLADLQDVAFVRSPLAHARIRAIHVPERYREVVFTAADLIGIKPIRAVSGLPGFKISALPGPWTSKSFRLFTTCGARVTPHQRWSMNIGATMCSWRAPSRSTSQ